MVAPANIPNSRRSHSNYSNEFYRNFHSKLFTNANWDTIRLSPKHRGCYNNLSNHESVNLYSRHVVKLFIPQEVGGAQQKVHIIEILTYTWGGSMLFLLLFEKNIFQKLIWFGVNIRTIFRVAIISCTTPCLSGRSWNPSIFLSLSLGLLVTLGLID